MILFNVLFCSKMFRSSLLQDVQVKLSSDSAQAAHSFTLLSLLSSSLCSQPPCSSSDSHPHVVMFRYNYLIRIEGGFAAEEDENMFPNRLMHAGRIRYNARGLEDLMTWIADPTLDRLLQHLKSMARNPEDVFPGDRCYKLLVSSWGRDALASLGISQQNVHNALRQLRQEGPAQGELHELFTGSLQEMA
eukprot:gene15558-21652_t